MDFRPTFSSWVFLLGVFLLLIFGAGSYLALKSDYFAKEGTTQTASTSTPLAALPPAVSASTSAPVLITPLPISSTNFLKTPALERPLNLPPSMGAEEVAILTRELFATREAILQNKQDLNAWTNLGVIYKALGDYQGALEAWKYVSLGSEADTVALNNLGNLYHYELRDYQKSEESFLKAVNNNPSYLLSYLNLHDLYRLSYQSETAKAVDILKRGLARNPQAVDLVVALASYYKEKGNKDEARVYYEQAITLAESLRNQSLKESLTAELRALK